MLGEDFDGHHPRHPLRWELTWLLVGTVSVFDGFEVFAAGAADAWTVGMVRTDSYIDAGRRASGPAFPCYSVGHGFGTADNPRFPNLHAAAALIAGGSVAAARVIARGEVDRAVNFCGGLHHAMADRAADFCVYNAPAPGVAALLPAGVGKVASDAVDAQHGDAQENRS